MGVTVCWWLAAVVGAFSVCRPFSAHWTSPPRESCGSMLDFWMAIAISHIVIDVMIISLPLPMVWKLQIKLPTKIGLSIIFTLGLLYGELTYPFGCIFFGFFELTLPHTASALWVAAACKRSAPSRGRTWPTRFLSLTYGRSSNPPSPSARLRFPSHGPPFSNYSPASLALVKTLKPRPSKSAAPLNPQSPTRLQPNPEPDHFGV